MQYMMKLTQSTALALSTGNDLAQSTGFQNIANAMVMIANQILEIYNYLILVQQLMLNTL
jgi:hypothetical protein